MIGKWCFMDFREKNTHHPYFNAAYGKSCKFYVNGFTYCLPFICIILFVLKYKNSIRNILDFFLVVSLFPTAGGLFGQFGLKERRQL